MPAIDQSGMRRQNTSATLRVLATTEDAVTTAQLVAATRLSRRTVELILADLIAAGWVREIHPPRPTGVGRPKRFFQLVADRTVVLSVVIDPPMIRASLADVRGAEIGYGERTCGSSAEETLRRALDAAELALAASRVDRSRLVAVVVGLPGTISPEGIVLTEPEDADWVGVDVWTPFADRFGGIVAVENDTNLSALAARAEGAAGGADTFAFLVPGVRVSAALVIGGELHRGVGGAAGELVRIPGIGYDMRDHPLALISSPDEAERARARALLRAAAAGDAQAREDAEAFLRGVARLIAVVGWVLAPPVIVLAAGFEEAQEIAGALLRRAQAGVDLPDLEVRLTTWDARMSLRGGVQLALAVADAEIFDAWRQ
jgi:predicted NBD/HSP70 family sugar kinase